MKDYCIRVTTGNKEVRGFFASTKNMVETARGFHNTSKVAQLHL